MQEFNVVKWCQEHEEKIEDNEKLMKQVAEICFETLDSKLKGINRRIILEKSESSEWNKGWKAFKVNKVTTNSAYWNLSLESDTATEEFKKQCIENSKKPFTDENKKLFDEVREYCSTTWIPRPN
ncbi:hypothetical protein A6V39_00755 [Candidatus Mycoplasma haematobovis]|uniref:Uncharacterized protein n=1 Tax=Candidatus Mycoplasma haematobovis TaxID=432608 RepID=A0A1A9QEZ4_9MOLU|nr:hypothetical protein [Candidatus Mycoplasma haematobovis]OAL10581.1 hypothetical protein A6V39_00755 [Candidatus Mycoplasma haematobovis]